MNARVGPIKPYELDWFVLLPVGAKMTALK